MKNRITLLLVVVGMVVALGGAAQAAVLQVQFSQLGPTAPLQTGWTQVKDAALNTTITTTIIGGDYDGLNVEAVGSHVRSYDTVSYGFLRSR